MRIKYPGQLNKEESSSSRLKSLRTQTFSAFGWKNDKNWKLFFVALNRKDDFYFAGRVAQPDPSEGNKGPRYK